MEFGTQQADTKMRIKNDSRMVFLMKAGRNALIGEYLWCMSSWFLRISIFLWSSSKFLVGTGMALAFLSPLEGVFWCAIGGVSGCFVWIFGGGKLIEFWKKYVRKGKKGRVFSRNNRFLVKLRLKGGLWLVAFLTPLILSIPAGCLFATTFESNKYKVLRIQAISVLFWSFAIFGFKAVSQFFMGT
jgi:hypothetical protein